MKEIKLEGLDLSVYTEKLSNDLEVIYVPYSNKKNYYISYATKFGSDTTSFVSQNSKEELKVPDGIAHFLEHKMFAQEDGTDPFSYFSESGTGSNASTSFNNTQYICYGTKKFEENLKYLLKFVNSPYYTDENVEKEKGIITEELKMYDDIPEYSLEMKLRQNIYHVSPRRIDIGGSIEEINKITKEDLYTCYNNFYVPNNMFLLIVGNFNKEEASKIIHNSQDNKESKKLPKIKNYKEPKTVKCKEETIKASVNVPKLAVGIKVPIKDIGLYEKLEIDLYLMMITTICFGSASEFRERIRNRKLLNSFYTEWETFEDYRVFYIMTSTNNPEELLEEIETELNNIVIKEDAFTRMKKVWIANEVRMIDYIDSTVRNIYDDYLKYEKVIPDKISIIRNLKLEEINKIVKKIDFNNKAIIKMMPNK